MKATADNIMKKMIATSRWLFFAVFAAVSSRECEGAPGTAEGSVGASGPWTAEGQGAPPPPPPPLPEPQGNYGQISGIRSDDCIGGFYGGCSAGIDKLKAKFEERDSQLKPKKKSGNKFAGNVFIGYNFQMSSVHAGVETIFGVRSGSVKSEGDKSNPVIKLTRRFTGELAPRVGIHLMGGFHIYVKAGLGLPRCTIDEDRSGVSSASSATGANTAGDGKDGKGGEAKPAEEGEKKEKPKPKSTWKTACNLGMGLEKHFGNNFFFGIEVTTSLGKGECGETKKVNIFARDRIYAVRGGYRF